MRSASAYLIGLIFGLGIVIAGMGDPSKVLNFFDLAGAWDPSLAFVMGGALVTTFLGYRLVLKRRAPLLGPVFQLPEKREIDARLLGGSALFGLGWGLAGFCPGGSLPMLGTGDLRVALFVGACVAGIVATRWITRMLSSPEAQPTKL